MQVNFHQPSELDAHVDGLTETHLTIHPKFYQPKGSAVIGTLQVIDNQGTVIDRVVLSVSGSGKINAAHRNEEVVPIADSENGDKQDGGAAKSSTDSG